MLAHGKLVNFGEFQKRAQDDIYIPGEVVPQEEPTPITEEGYNLRFPFMLWDKPFDIPEDDPSLGRPPARKLGRPVRQRPWHIKLGRPVRQTAWHPFKSKEFIRFHGGKSLRQPSKMKMLERLAILPSGNITRTIPFVGFRNIRQQPQFFPELAGFGDFLPINEGAPAIPVGAANPTGGGPATTGIWGNLISALTTAGQTVLQVQTQRTQREVAASQAAIAAAQTQTAQAGITQSLYQNLPLLIALAGGGAILYIYVSKKRATAKG